MLVGTGMKRTLWRPELTPRALLQLGFPSFPEQSHAIVFFADRQGTPQRLLEEAVHGLPFNGFIVGLTDRMVDVFLQERLIFFHFVVN